MIYNFPLSDSQQKKQALCSLDATLFSFRTVPCLFYFLSLRSQQFIEHSLICLAIRESGLSINAEQELIPEMTFLPFSAVTQE